MQLATKVYSNVDSVPCSTRTRAHTRHDQIFHVLFTCVWIPDHVAPPIAIVTNHSFEAKTFSSWRWSYSTLKEKRSESVTKSLKQPVGEWVVSRSVDGWVSQLVGG